jgi:hypothetical protein
MSGFGLKCFELGGTTCVASCDVGGSAGHEASEGQGCISSLAGWRSVARLIAGWRGDQRWLRYTINNRLRTGTDKGNPTV